MAIQGPYSNWTLLAGEDLSNLNASTEGHLFKAITTAGLIASTSETALGILQYGGKQGEHITVGYAGVMKFIAKASIPAGSLLTVTTSGYFIPATTNSLVIGRCLDSDVSANAVGTGIFNFATPAKK